mmetsp:Transcript_23382/g.56833  ORF Transcript_23382/g.56833 Transcript_23382/m.56833 type:complete len:453 (-) Transcript_23382:185-1543(-)
MVEVLGRGELGSRITGPSLSEEALGQGVVVVVSTTARGVRAGLPAVRVAQAEGGVSDSGAGRRIVPAAPACRLPTLAPSTALIKAVVHSPLRRHFHRDAGRQPGCTLLRLEETVEHFVGERNSVVCAVLLGIAEAEGVSASKITVQSGLSHIGRGAARVVIHIQHLRESVVPHVGGHHATGSAAANQVHQPVVVRNVQPASRVAHAAHGGEGRGGGVLGAECGGAEGGVLAPGGCDVRDATCCGVNLEDLQVAHFTCHPPPSDIHVAPIRHSHSPLQPRRQQVVPQLRPRGPVVRGQPHLPREVGRAGRRTIPPGEGALGCCGELTPCGLALGLVPLQVSALAEVGGTVAPPGANQVVVHLSARRVGDRRPIPNLTPVHLWRRLVTVRHSQLHNLPLSKRRAARLAGVHAIPLHEPALTSSTVRRTGVGHGGAVAVQPRHAPDHHDLVRPVH